MLLFYFFVCVFVVELLPVFIGCFKAAWQYISTLQYSEKHNKVFCMCHAAPSRVVSKRDLTVPTIS